MESEFAFIVTGIIFGLSGGLTPGPLLTLVIAETLRHGIKEGIKISTAPLFSDFPIVVGALYLISRIADMMPVLGTIALLGTVFLIYLGYENFTFKGVELKINSDQPKSLRKGILANFLNPSPYVFWISIGGPTVFKALNVSLLAAILFIFFMYLCLVGSKILLSIVVGKSRIMLKSKNYVYTIRLLGIVLWLFAIVFLFDGLKSFGILS